MSALSSALVVAPLAALGALAATWRLNKIAREHRFYWTYTHARLSPVVCITGASSGIGAALARAYAARGARLVLAARRASELAAVAAACRALFPAADRGAVCIVVADVSTEKGASAVVAAALETYGRLDVLVLNAGIGAHALFAECETGVFERLMATNFFGYLYCAKAALAALRAARGQIVVVNSLSGEVGLAWRSAYCASKFAVTGLFESLRMEEPAVHITIVCPPSVRTQFRENLISGREVSAPAGSHDTRLGVDECVRVILNAIDYGKRKVYFPTGAWAAAYIRPLFPDLVDYVLRARSAL